MKSGTLLTALPFLALIGAAQADTIRLKNGTTYQGKVLKEDNEHYVLEVQVTKSIKDEKRIPKADVAAIDREQADKKAYEELLTLVPAPDLLDAGAYQTRIAKVYAFLKAHPASSHAPQAKKIAAELEQEQTAIEAGGVKLNGRILTADARQADAVEIDARVLAASARQLAESGALVPALRKAAELEKDFASTLTFREFLPYFRQLIQTHRARTATTAAGYEARVKERDGGLAQMQINDRAATESAIAEQAREGKARYDAEKKAGHKWLSPDQWNKPALDEAVRHADQELKRLDALKLDTAADGGKAWREAWSAIHASPVDPKALNEALGAARSARLPQRYQTRLDAAAKAAAPNP